MPPVMTNVFSSHVEKMGYDPEAQELYVQWTGGKTSIYSGVPADVADRVSRSWSIGQAMAEVKAAYAHRYA